MQMPKSYTIIPVCKGVSRHGNTIDETFSHSFEFPDETSKFVDIRGSDITKQTPIPLKEA
jgi:hypothetical protein